MKKLLHFVHAFFCLLFTSAISMAQAPDLASCSNFAFFTAAGAFTNTGSTMITGDVGTHVGLFTGFPPGNILGSIHVADAVTAQAAIDVAEAYASLQSNTCGAVFATTIPDGTILSPNIYCLGAASTLSGNLTLDAVGDPNAVFIFQIDGAFSTSTFSNVILTNSASWENVYWQVNGEFILGDGSNFKGTVIAEGAITLLEGSAIEGRALSTAGAISLHNILAILIVSPPLSTVAEIKVINVANRNHIVWNTNTDNIGETFILERSSDGITFFQISKMASLNTPGTYSFWDENPLIGVNQYRIKLINASGSFSYSSIVTIVFKKSNNVVISAYPNPVVENLNIYIGGTVGNLQTITLTDFTGKTIKVKSFNGNRISMPMSGFSKGIYFVKYYDENGYKTIKVLKK